MRTLRRHRTSDANVDRLEDSVLEWSKQFDRNPWLDGVLIENRSLVAGANVITHKLGRAPRGWWLMKRKRAAAANYPAETASDINTLTLDSSVTDTVTIWVW